MSEMTKENARKMNFYGNTLEECVNSLLKFQQRGESVVIEFNGHNLYSCDVTMDSAYIEVTGQTKAEFDKAQEQRRKEYEERRAREKAEEKAEAQAKIPAWIEKGKAYIYPERMEEWKECVEARAGDLYHGIDIDSALALMEKLESGASMEEVKEMFEEQNHSGAGEGMVRRLMFHFAKRGPEFYESTAWRELSEEDKKVIEDKKRENAVLEEIHSPKEEGKDVDPYSQLKASAVEVDFSWKYGNTIEAVVKELEEYRARGESVVIDFNGHKLYSCNVTMDSAYTEITGQTKAEFDKAQEEGRKEYEERRAREKAEEKAEAQAKIPAWIEKGKAYIYPERMEEWKECVEARAGDLYHGIDIDSALALMEKLESGASMEEVKEMFEEQNHSGAGEGMVRRLMFHFAKRGPEFYESTAWRELSEEDKKVIEDKKRENAELEELHKTDSTKEVPAERRAEEKGIVESSSEKAQLTSEIGDIEQQLEELRAKEAELKKALEEKQSKLNGLEEK